MTSLLRALRLLVSTSIRVAPVASLGCLAEVAGVLVALLQPWSLALFIAGATAGDQHRMITAAALFVGQIALSRLLFMIGISSRINQMERVGATFAAEIARVTATIPTVDHLDDPRYLDQLQILRERSGAIGLAVNTLLNQLNSVVGVVGVLIMAASADPRMLVVALAGVPTVLAGPIVARWRGRAEAASAEPGRLARALLRLGIDPEHFGEVRVFGLADGLRARLRAAARAWRRPLVIVAVREAGLTAITQVLFFSVAAAVIALLVGDTLAGRADIVGLTLALLLVTRLQNVSGELRGVVSELADMTRTAGRFLWLLDAADRITADHIGAEEPPRRPGRLSLSGVSYHYPGSERAALAGITLDLAPGTVLAVVGENGAGKSTLAEVITGLRTATAGAITVGGADLTTLDVAAWQARLSGAFQDHVRFELILSETVGIGDLPRRDDQQAVRAGIRAGAAEAVVDTVPAGLATQLGASWPGGIDLSGGQWQRLAIARGMMRDAPLIRVLDEPTAALDAITEHQLFDRYAAAARSGRETGTITILITHRFSTVASADVIAVLDHGRLIEYGSHDDLIAAGGHYAELYELQARGYRPSDGGR
ncbi:ABC transporter ATP-binding protein [Microlunatus speluncae]|uniref:ABC transporter ATP-binding protein n=1 Tax=Microlunatus speluncae TaxID=2594267 RepID=UPI0012666E7B|nr:ABC transporter ATP-binding protein [Microlunatus speluncae]